MTAQTIRQNSTCTICHRARQTIRLQQHEQLQQQITLGTHHSQHLFMKGLRRLQQSNVNAAMAHFVLKWRGANSSLTSQANRGLPRIFAGPALTGAPPARRPIRRIRPHGKQQKCMSSSMARFAWYCSSSAMWSHSLALPPHGVPLLMQSWQRLGATPLWSKRLPTSSIGGVMARGTQGLA